MSGQQHKQQTCLCDPVCVYVSCCDKEVAYMADSGIRLLVLYSYGLYICVSAVCLVYNSGVVQVVCVLGSISMSASMSLLEVMTCN